MTPRAQIAPEAGLTIVYDGQCPFCSNFVALMTLKQAVGRVDLIDARSAHPLVATLFAQKYDLDEGLVVIYGEKVYYGSDAVALISDLSNRGGRIARLISFVLSGPRRANIIYPWMKAGRRVVLKMLGRSRIRKL